MLKYEQVYAIAQKVRKEIIKKYDEPLGHCVEASERIIEELNKLGEEAQLIEGWVQYDDWSGCSDRSYDEHTWVEYGNYVIDVTGDQFDHFMDEPCPEIYIGALSYPNGWCKEEPDNLADDEDDWYEEY